MMTRLAQMSVIADVNGRRETGNADPPIMILTNMLKDISQNPSRNPLGGVLFFHLATLPDRKIVLRAVALGFWKRP